MEWIFQAHCTISSALNNISLQIQFSESLVCRIISLWIGLPARLATLSELRSFKHAPPCHDVNKITIIAWSMLDIPTMSLITKELLSVKLARVSQLIDIERPC